MLVWYLYHWHSDGASTGTSFHGWRCYFLILFDIVIWSIWLFLSRLLYFVLVSQFVSALCSAHYVVVLRTLYYLYVTSSHSSYFPPLLHWSFVHLFMLIGQLILLVGILPMAPVSSLVTRLLEEQETRHCSLFHRLSQNIVWWMILLLSIYGLVISSLTWVSRFELLLRYIVITKMLSRLLSIQFFTSGEAYWDWLSLCLLYFFLILSLSLFLTFHLGAALNLFHRSLIVLHIFRFFLANSQWLTPVSLKGGLGACVWVCILYCTCILVLCIGDTWYLLFMCA